MNLPLIDTNIVFDIVFDIVYGGRYRHKIAIEFYKQFKNYELSIEKNVYTECSDVLYKYSSDFSMDFKNFLDSNSKFWNKMDKHDRSEIIDIFLKNMDNKRGVDYIPFYHGIIDKVEDDLIYFRKEDLIDFIFNLPSKMVKYLCESIESRFSTVFPDSYAEDTDIINDGNINELYNMFINNYFNPRQSYDALILTSLIDIINYGNKIDGINFYTCDGTFVKNFKKISSNKPSIQNMELKKYFLNGIENITFKKPYS